MWIGLLIVHSLVAASPAASARAASIRDELLLAEAARLLEQHDPSGALERVTRLDPAPIEADDAAAHRSLFRKSAIEGRALAALGLWAEAVQPLRTARRSAEARGASLTSTLELLLARAEEANGDCRAALESLRRADAAVWHDDDAVLVQVRCHHALEREDAVLADIAYAELLAIEEHTLVELRALRVMLLVERGLAHAASEDVLWLAGTAEIESALRVIGMISVAGLVEVSREALEVLLARHPDDLRVNAQLARMLRRDSPRAAARVLQAAMLRDSSLGADVAELQREAGDHRGALDTTARIASAPARLRQRLAIFVDEQRWDRALALGHRLRVTGSGDASVAYALAYASFQTGDLDGAEGWLEDVTDSSWFDRATALRAAIAACRSTEAPCAH